MLLLLAACDDDSLIPLHFDGPVAAAFLPEDAGGPFDTPVGFVANSRSGTIVPLDLKEERLLNDDRAGSFLRAAAIPTGTARTLADVAVYANAGAVTLWAADQAYDQVLRVPYTTGVEEDGTPIEVEPTTDGAAFVDADQSGDSATIDEVTLRAGFTTTEDWSIEYDGAAWWAKGSRSGTMTKHPVEGIDYQSDGGEVQFTIQGGATAGDRFDLRTDSGLLEWDLGGKPTSVDVVGTRLYTMVLSSPPRVYVMDAESGDYLGAVALPEETQPWRATFATDGRMFVADANSAQVFVLHFEAGVAVDDTEVESLAVAAAPIDVAWQAGEGADGTPFERLFVAPVGMQRVDVYDLLTNAWVDPNPVTAEVAGVELGSPISGLTPSVDTVWMQQETAWGALPRVPTVVVSTQDGYTLQLDASTGCYVTDSRGPHGPYTDESYDQDYPWATLDDHGDTSDTQLYVDYVSSVYGEQIVASPCGGVLRSEGWTLTYTSAQDAWIVEGTVSGVQANLAYEDERYLSDDGGLSFLLVSGPLPSTDGDQFTFLTDRGLASVIGTDANDDASIGTGDTPYELPARPVAFDYTTGDQGGGWDEVDRREFALLPVQNTDVVGKVQLDKGKATFQWE